MRPELLITHMARPARRVMHNHHLIHAQLIYCHQQRPHSRIHLRQHQPSRILDDLCISVPKPQRPRQQLRQPRIHTREHRQLLSRILVRDQGLIPLLRHEPPIIFKYRVNHSPNQIKQSQLNLRKNPVKEKSAHLPTCRSKPFEISTTNKNNES